MIEAVEFDQASAANGHAAGTGSHARPPFMVAVQWHPEAGDDQSLFAALIEAASQAATGTVPLSRQSSTDSQAPSLGSRAN